MELNYIGLIILLFAAVVAAVYVVRLMGKNGKDEVIETERLRLIALSPTSLRLWAKDISALEKDFGFTYKGEVLDNKFRDLILTQADIAEKDMRNMMFHTFFLILLKTENTVIGSIDYKDKPNENGEVELGYGLSEEYRHYGYMTEAVHMLTDFALQYDGVKAIVAETEKGNTASENVLKRVGFVEEGEDSNYLRWRYR